jgi:hypothetical protein
MKRSTFALTATFALLLGSMASAQGTPPNPANENDMATTVSVNGGDFLYVYNDPSLGQAAGLAVAVADAVDDTDWYWKVNPKGTLNSCNDALEMAGLTFFIFDFDFAVGDGGVNGFNCAAPDMIFSDSNNGVGSVTPGNLEPDFLDAAATLLQFGPSDINNNTILPDPGCPPAGYLYGYQLDAALSTGVGDGLIILADGATDLVQTVVLPGGAHTFSGGNSCLDPTAGTGTLPDLHSGTAAGGIGETQFDVLGDGLSANGGYGIAGAITGTDVNAEIAVNSVQFFEPITVMRVDSATGVGMEEGTGSINYDCPAGVGGALGARLYAWQGIGRPAAVLGTLAAPLGTCVNFLGGKLGLSPTDPLFGIFLGLWQGTVVQTDNGLPLGGTVFDDGTFDTLSLPLPAQVIPVGFTVPLSFQGFYKTTSGAVVGSQVRKLFLHG